MFSEKWLYDQRAVDSFETKEFNFDVSNSGINLPDSVPITEIDIFKAVFDEYLVQHIVEETNKYYRFIVSTNKDIKVRSKLRT